MLCVQMSGVQGVSSSLTGVATPMIQLFQRLYSTRTAPSIIKYNNFSDVGLYFLLKVSTMALENSKHFTIAGKIGI